MVGEVITLPVNHSASYGPGRVRGPKVNLTDSGNGEWKGNIRDLDGVFTVTEKRISGGNLNMVMDRDGRGVDLPGHGGREARAHRALARRARGPLRHPALRLEARRPRPLGDPHRRSGASG